MGGGAELAEERGGVVEELEEMNVPRIPQARSRGFLRRSREALVGHEGGVVGPADEEDHSDHREAQQLEPEAPHPRFVHLPYREAQRGTHVFR